MKVGKMQSQTKIYSEFTSNDVNKNERDNDVPSEQDQSFCHLDIKPIRAETNYADSTNLGKE